jgi:hypothetical protein
MFTGVGQDGRHLKAKKTPLMSDTPFVPGDIVSGLDPNELRLSLT